MSDHTHDSNAPQGDSPATPGPAEAVNAFGAPLPPPPPPTEDEAASKAKQVSIAGVETGRPSSGGGIKLSTPGAAAPMPGALRTSAGGSGGGSLSGAPGSGSTERGGSIGAAPAPGGPRTSAGAARASATQRKSSSGIAEGPLPASVKSKQFDENRRSIAKRLSLAVKSKEREGGQQKVLRRPKKIYDNSFRLESHVPYSRDKVQKILEATLDEMFDGFLYHQEKSNDLAVKICEKLRQRVLALKFDRYKLIVMANIGPLNRQGLHIGFRCLWDGDRDTYNIHTVQTFNAFCTAVIYAVYFE